MLRLKRLIGIGIGVLLLAVAPSSAGNRTEQKVSISVEPIAEILLEGEVESVVQAVPGGAGEIILSAGGVTFSYSTNASDQVLIQLGDDLPEGVEVRVRVGASTGVPTTVTLETNPQVALSGIVGTAARDIPVTYEIVVTSEAEPNSAQGGYQGTVTYTLVG